MSGGLCFILIWDFQLNTKIICKPSSVKVLMNSYWSLKSLKVLPFSISHVFIFLLKNVCGGCRGCLNL